MAWIKKGSSDTGNGTGASPPPSNAAAEDALAQAKAMAAECQRIAKLVEEQASQSAFMRHQIGQLGSSVAQLNGLVASQSIQSRENDQALLKELQRFQTGGPQRAMAGVFAKLFRDLLRHLNQLDSLVDLAAARGVQPDEAAWIEALKVERSHFEGILREWGLRPIEVRIGHDDFDPEIHEADAGEAASHDSSASHRIVAVKRRGWMLGDTILQNPVVVTG